MVTIVVLDVEGTTTPIRFVHDVLFPFARAALPGFVRARGGEPDVAAVLREVPGEPVETLLQWIDEDRKATALKTLQGMIWRDGYVDGRLKGVVYPDVAPALRRWRAAGARLFVYSSGSVEAQKLIFGHSTAGDLAGLFEGHFDTVIGGKREASSYRAIAAAVGGVGVFLSDVAAELDAAVEAGWRTCQLVRAEDGTVASGRHEVAADFDVAGRMLGLD